LIWKAAMVDAPTLATVATASPASAAPVAPSAAPAQQPVAPAPTETNVIPGFDKMSFAQQRLAQDQAAAAARTSKQKR
jgi:hypothetical protein